MDPFRDHQYSDLPQVVPVTDQFPERVHPLSATLTGDTKTDQQPDYSNKAPGSGKRICGLAARTFWIVSAIAAVVLVAAAVGGGVAGALALRSNNNNNKSSISTTAPKASASSKHTVKPTTSEPSSVTSTKVVGPTKTLFRDCPSSNDTLYSVSLDSKDYVFRKYCGTVIIGNGDDVVNKPVTSLNACINLCAGYNSNNATKIAAGTSEVWCVFLSRSLRHLLSLCFPLPSESEFMASR